MIPRAVFFITVDLLLQPFWHVIVSSRSCESGGPVAGSNQQRLMCVAPGVQVARREPRTIDSTANHFCRLSR